MKLHKNAKIIGGGKFMRSFLFILSVYGLLTLSVTADIVTLTSGDAKGTSSFTDAARWSNKEVPSAENDYVVASNRGIRSPANASESTFGGNSLTLGDSSSSGHLALKTSNNKSPIITINDLRVVHKDSDIGNAGNYNNDGATVTLRGSVTFSVKGSGAKVNSGCPTLSMHDKRKIHLESSLIAEEGCGFRAQGDCSEGYLYLRGDNSSYHGYMNVDTINLYVANAKALGPNPSVKTLLTGLYNGATVLFENGVEIDQPNRGIWLGEGGGKIYEGENTSATTSMFIETDKDNPAKLTKIGPGWSFFSGESSLVDVEIKQGRLGLAGEITGSLAVSNVSDKAFLSVASSNSTLTLSCPVALLAPTKSWMMFPTNALGSPSGMLVLKEGFALKSGWPFRWQSFWGVPATSISATLFKIDPRVRRVSPDDFVCANAEKDGYARRYRITTDDEGMQLVTWEQYAIADLVTLEKTNAKGQSWMTTDKWSNGVAAETGKDYLVDTATKKCDLLLRTPVSNSDTYQVFPGNSLKFEGTEAYPAYFGLKAKKTFVTNMIVSGVSQISPSSYSGGDKDLTHTLDGGIYISANSKLCLYGRDRHTLALDADLSGCGSIDLRPTTGESIAVSVDRLTVDLGGDNSAFRGAINVWGPKISSAPSVCEDYVAAGVHPVILRLSDGNNLGGECDTPLEKGLHLRGACKLWPKQTMTISCTNRYVQFDGNAYVQVDDGQTLTIESPIAWVGNTYKQGGGILAVGKARIINDGLNSVNVQDGFIKATTTNGMNGVKAIFASGAGVVVVADSAGELGYFNVTRDDPFDLTACGGKLSVTVEDTESRAIAAAKASTSKVRVNILTVSSAAASNLDGNIVCTCDGWKATVVKGEADTNGYVTFTATFAHRGLAISIR